MQNYQQIKILLLSIIITLSFMDSAAASIGFGAGNYIFTTGNASYNCTASGQSPNATITFYRTYASSNSCSNGILTFNLFNQTPAPILLPNSTYHILSSFVDTAVNRIVNTFSLSTPTCMAITNFNCNGRGQVTYTNRFWNISCNCTSSSCSCSLLSGAPYPQITFP